MTVHHNTPPAGLGKVDFAAITEADIDAYFRSAEEDSASAHKLALEALVAYNPRLAARLVQRQTETGLPVDALTLVGFMVTHVRNASLERMLEDTPAAG